MRRPLLIAYGFLASGTIGFFLVGCLFLFVGGLFSPPTGGRGTDDFAIYSGLAGAVIGMVAGAIIGVRLGNKIALPQSSAKPWIATALSLIPGLGCGHVYLGLLKRALFWGLL